MASQVIIPVRAPLVGPDGLVTREWINYLNAVDVAANGGDDDGPIDASRLFGEVPLATLVGLTDAQISRLAQIAWSKISKVGSSLGDLENRDAQDIISGLLALARGGTHADLSATGIAGPPRGYLKQTAVGADITVAVILEPDLPTGIDAAKISAGIVSNTEFDYLDGLTDNIQTQLDNKLIHPRLRKSGWWFVEPQSATTPRLVGSPAIATAGTPAAVQKAVSAYTQFPTTTALNNVARINHDLAGAGLPMRTRWDPTVIMDIYTDPSSITGLMYFFGIYGSNTPPTSGTGTNSDYAGFRYLPGTDSNWVAITNDGVIANQVVTDLATAIAVDTRYQLKMVFSGLGTSVDFYIDGVLVGTVTTPLPTTNVNVGVWMQCVNKVGGAGTSRSFLWSHVFHDQE